jgi:hypothetical protein
MSSVQRAARPLDTGRSRIGAGAREQARLSVVPRGTAKASSGAFALFVGAVLVLGLLGLLALNTLLAQGAFATSDLNRQQSVLADQREALQEEVAVLESSEQLAAAARQLGMVGTKNPVFLDPATGKIMGVPLAGAYPAAPKAAASASASPTASGTPTATATAKAKAKASASPAASAASTVKPGATG